MLRSSDQLEQSKPGILPWRHEGVGTEVKLTNTKCHGPWSLKNSIGVQKSVKVNLTCAPITLTASKYLARANVSE